MKEASGFLWFIINMCGMYYNCEFFTSMKLHLIPNQQLSESSHQQPPSGTHIPFTQLRKSVIVRNP